MSMPNELVFIRHAQSEANVIQKADRRGEPHAQTELVHQRPDWQQRLSRLGIEQAKTAKIWVDRELGGAASFDLRYVSSFIRANETAAYIDGEDSAWRYDDRIIERDWGHYGAVTEEERAKLYARTKDMHEKSPWYTRLDGGQSRSDMSLAYRIFQDTLHRDADGKRVLVVTHGDFIAAARYNIERMLPEEFEQVEADPTQSIRNVMAIEYSRTNPFDRDEVRDAITWRRMTDTINPDQSPFDGQWIQLPRRRELTSSELLARAALVPHLLTDQG